MTNPGFPNRKVPYKLPTPGRLWYTRLSTNILTEKISTFSGRVVRHLDEVVPPNTPIFVLKVSRVNSTLVGVADYEYEVLLPKGTQGIITEAFQTNKQHLSKLIPKPL